MHDDRRAPPRIAYLDGRRFRRLLIAGVHNVERHRAELDRINVFPVPDQIEGGGPTLEQRAAGTHHASRGSQTA